MHQRWQILIADHQGSTADTVIAPLRDAGYECVQPSSLARAIEQASIARFSVIVAGRGTPEDATLDTLASAAGNVQLPPVVLLTDALTTAEVAQMLSLPITACLPTSVDPLQLLDSVREAVSLFLSTARARTIVESGLASLQAFYQLSCQLEDHPFRRVLAVTQGLMPTISNLKATVPINLRNGAGFPDLAFTQTLNANPPPRVLELEQLLRDAVEVLRLTKNAFKSKQLGALRMRLESGLRESPLHVSNTPTEGACSPHSDGHL